MRQSRADFNEKTQLFQHFLTLPQLCSYKRYAAVKHLEAAGWRFDAGAWTAPARLAASGASDKTIAPVADPMHAYLMDRADSLAGATENSDEEAELVRVGELIENYEAARWPTGRVEK